MEVTQVGGRSLHVGVSVEEVESWDIVYVGPLTITVSGPEPQIDSTTEREMFDEAMRRIGVVAGQYAPL